MVLHAGESVLITHTAQIENRELTPADTEGVFVLITRVSDGDLVLTEREMSWSADNERWEYAWRTAGLPPGTYRARVKLVGLDERPAWEFKRIRLARNPD